MKNAARIGIVGTGLSAASVRYRLVRLVRESWWPLPIATLRRRWLLLLGTTLRHWALVSREDIDAVVVAVTNVYVAEIVMTALRNGKHVLCEKPFGISTGESSKMHKAAVKAGKMIKVGFNHRFHAAVVKAHDLLDKGAIGDVLFVRARYGHGGRKGMEKEWRFDRSISSGGELLDQGVHIIDLARWFAGDFKTAYGLAQTMFWDAQVDDNAFALLKNDTATLEFHVSTTNWKNIFSFEGFGNQGFL